MMGSYFYDQQIKRHLIEFMAVFAGMQVRMGDVMDPSAEMINVPITYGVTDRVVADILANNTVNTPIRLPMMAAQCLGLELAPDLASGIGTIRRHAYVPLGGVVPDDIKVVYEAKPFPYRCNVELAILASNTEQLMQIVEQIALLFDPILQIQTSDAGMDFSRITYVELESIDMDTSYPSATDRRVIQATMKFNFPIYMSLPAEIKRNYVKSVFMRISAMGSDFDFNNGFDVIAAADAAGVQYQKVADADNSGVR